MRTTRKLSLVKFGTIAGLVVLSTVVGSAVASADTTQASVHGAIHAVHAVADGSPWDSPKPRFP